MRPQGRLRLGELLVEARIISREQLEQILVLQREDGRRLGTLLVERQLIGETQLTQILSQQLSVPWVSLHHIDFSRKLLGLIPRDTCERYCLVPIYVRSVRGQGDVLYVAMDDPMNEDALTACGQSAGLPARAMIAAPTDIRAAIRIYYAGASLPPVRQPTAAPVASVALSPELVELPSEVRELPGMPAVPPVPPPPKGSGSPLGAASPPPLSSALPPAPPPPVNLSDGPAEVTPQIAAVIANEMPRVIVEEAPVAITLPVEIAQPIGNSQMAVAVPVPQAIALPVPPPVTPMIADPSPASQSQPVIELREVAIPARTKKGRTMSLTMLDGTTIAMPVMPRRRGLGEPAVSPLPPEEPSGEGGQDLTISELLAALRALAHGAEASEDMQPYVRWERLMAGLLTLLVRKRLVMPRELIEELKKI